MTSLNPAPLHGQGTGATATLPSCPDHAPLGGPDGHLLNLSGEVTDHWLGRLRLAQRQARREAEHGSSACTPGHQPTTNRLPDSVEALLVDFLAAARPNLRRTAEALTNSLGLPESETDLVLAVVTQTTGALALGVANDHLAVRRGTFWGLARIRARLHVLYMAPHWGTPESGDAAA